MSSRSGGSPASIFASTLCITMKRISINSSERGEGDRHDDEEHAPGGECECREKPRHVGGAEDPPERDGGEHQDRKRHEPVHEQRLLKRCRGSSSAFCREAVSND